MELTVVASIFCFIERAVILGRDQRDRVMTLDFRTLVALQYRYGKDWRALESTVTCQWVLHRVKSFPNLRILILDGLKTYWEDAMQVALQEPPDPVQGTNLYVFSCSKIRDFDSSVYVQKNFLKHVMYLDVSFTIIGHDWVHVFSEFSLSNLRVLKLRGLRLTDSQLPIDTISGGNLWSLDLRENYFTDAILQYLYGLFGPRLAPVASESHMAASDTMLYEDVPRYQQDHPDPSQITNDDVPLRPDTLDGLLLYMKEQANLVNPSSEITDGNNIIVRPTGLTHLYLANNQFSSKGITRLLEHTNRLQVLDVGSPLHLVNSPVPRSIGLGVVDVAKFLMRSNGSRMESLRIHHSFVTAIPTVIRGRLSPGWLPEALHKAENLTSDPDITHPVFHPDFNHRLSSLILTDIPTKSYGPTIHRLTAFISECAAQEQALIAARTTIPHRHAPLLLPGIRLLRLQFLSEEVRDSTGQSFSGDRDADTFHQEGSDDFSFFDDGGQIGDGSSRSPTTLSRSSTVSSLPYPSDTQDVVEELRRYRAVAVPRWGGRLEIVL